MTMKEVKGAYRMNKVNWFEHGMCDLTCTCDECEMNVWKRYMIEVLSNTWRRNITEWLILCCILYVHCIGDKGVVNWVF